MKTNKEKMISGELYQFDCELQKENYAGKHWCKKFNDIDIENEEMREALISGNSGLKIGQNHRLKTSHPYF